MLYIGQDAPNLAELIEDAARKSVTMIVLDIPVTNQTWSDVWNIGKRFGYFAEQQDWPGFFSTRPETDDFADYKTGARSTFWLHKTIRT